MPMHNLLESSGNYSMTSESLWNYYRDEMNDDANEDAANYRVNNNTAITSKPFEYKTKLIGTTRGNNNAVNMEIVVPLNLSN